MKMSLEAITNQLMLTAFLYALIVLFFLSQFNRYGKKLDLTYVLIVSYFSIALIVFLESF